MTTTLEAIQTSYKGCKFRSRLEARWAVWLDAVNVNWCYEQQGYDLGREGSYLPDFWLPEFDCFLEVKPIEPDEHSRGWKVARSLAMHSGYDVWMVFDPQFRSFDLRRCWDVPAIHWDASGKCSHRQAFQVVSPKAETFDIDPNWPDDKWCAAMGEILKRKRENAAVFLARHGIDLEGEWLVNAFRAFRSARFEFGQSGA